MVNLSFDVGSKSIVPWQGSPSALPVFIQGTETFRLRFVEQNPDAVAGLNQYQAIVLTDYAGPIMGLFTDVSFEEGYAQTDALALLLQDGFTLNVDDASDPYYEGILNMLTAEISALGTLKTKAVYLAVGLVRASDSSVNGVLRHRGNTNATLEAALSGGFSAALPVSVVPSRRIIQLPVYFKSEDGLREYVMLENPAQDGLISTRYP